MKLKELESFYSSIKESLNSELIIDLNDKFNKIDKLVIKEWKTFKISELLELVIVKKKFKVDGSKEGKYPLITRSGKNNGITKFINDYSIDFNCFTIAPSGSVGYCFYHDYPIAVDGILKVFKPKTDIDPKLLALIITDKLANKYSYTNGLTNDKILNEIINVPIFEV